MCGDGGGAGERTDLPACVALWPSSPRGTGGSASSPRRVPGTRSPAALLGLLLPSPLGR